jgi:hypothetical protein
MNRLIHDRMGAFDEPFGVVGWPMRIETGAAICPRDGKDKVLGGVCLIDSKVSLGHMGLAAKPLGRRW